jgi:predicted esterase
VRRLLAAGTIFALTSVTLTHLCSADELSGEIKTWTKKGMLAGATSTEEECVRPDRVWVTDKGKGYCIRYFKNDVKPKAGIAVVIFQGDYVAIGWQDGKRIKPSYLADYDGKAAFRVTRELVTRSKKNLMIFVSRLGTLGSSGDHKQKFKPVESRVINSALDQIKERLGLNGFVLVGHSGGALLVANLLAKRSDIKCAVMNSGAHDVYKYAEDSGFDSTIWALWENPVASIANLKPSSTQYYVIAGVGDKVRPPAYQEMFADALAMKGADVHYLLVRKRGDPHNLQSEAIKAADLCASGGTVAEIKKGFNVVDKRYRLQLVKWLETGNYSTGFRCHLGFKVGNFSPSDLTGLTIALSYSGKGRIGTEVTHMERLTAGETREFEQTISTNCDKILEVHLQSANAEDPPAKGNKDSLKKTFTAFSKLWWITFEN